MPTALGGRDVSSSDAVVTRLEGMDKAIVLLQHAVDKMPTSGVVEEHVIALKELTNTRLLDLQALTDAKFDGNKTALDAALKTQKEASDKLESNFTKQLDTMAERVGELRDSMKSVEGKSTGVSTTTGFLFTLLGTIVGFAGIAIALISFLTRGP